MNDTLFKLSNVSILLQFYYKMYIITKWTLILKIKLALVTYYFLQIKTDLCKGYFLVWNCIKRVLPEYQASIRSIGGRLSHSWFTDFPFQCPDWAHGLSVTLSYTTSLFFVFVFLQVSPSSPDWLWTPGTQFPVAGIMGTCYCPIPWGYFFFNFRSKIKI